MSNWEHTLSFHIIGLSIPGKQCGSWSYYIWWLHLLACHQSQSSALWGGGRLAGGAVEVQPQHRQLQWCNTAIDCVLSLTDMLCSVILHRFLAHVEVSVVFGSASVSLAADESIHAEHTHKAGGTGCFTSSCWKRNCCMGQWEGEYIVRYNAMLCIYTRSLCVFLWVPQ